MSRMRKKLVVKLDDDVVEGLRHLDEAERADLSAFANEALRDALHARKKRQALDDWLNEWAEEHGHPTPEQEATAQAFWDEVVASETSDSATS